MSTETVPVEKESVANQEEKPVEQNQETVVENAAAEPPASEETKEETQVPLKALQKERQKRQEIEYEYKYYKEQQEKTKQPPEPDESQYDPVTKADLNKQLAAKEMQIIRSVQEAEWRRNNPEKAAIVDEKLEGFLKQKPHYVSALNAVTNRYSEAWELMDKFTPKQKAASKPAPVKSEAPGSPASVPKAAGINQAVDVMQMNDKEFADWRASKRKRR